MRHSTKKYTKNNFWCFDFGNTQFYRVTFNYRTQSPQLPIVPVLCMAAASRSVACAKGRQPKCRVQTSVGLLLSVGGSVPQIATRHSWRHPQQRSTTSFKAPTSSSDMPPKFVSIVLSVQLTAAWDTHTRATNPAICLQLRVNISLSE